MLLEKSIDNQTYLTPHYEAHNKYTTGINTISCRSVTTLRAYQCEYIENTKSCHEVEGLFDYSYFIYCIVVQSAGSNQILFSHIFLSVLIIAYSGLVCNIAYTKLCPNIIAIMRFIKLSQHTTGVIIISTLCGLSEFITGFSYRLRKEDTALFINMILGDDLYTKTFGVGILIIHYPLRIFPRYLIRDVLFYLPCFITFILMLRDQVVCTSLVCGLVFLLIWILYCSVVLFEDFYLLKIYKGDLDPQQKPLKHIYRNREINEFKSPNYRLFTQFFVKFSPLRIDKFKTNRTWLKILYFTFFPLRIIIDFVIPTVDYQLQHEGWTKLFNCINIVTLPIVIMAAYKIRIYYIIMVSMFTLFLALLVFLTSRTDRPPSYHYIFAIIGLFGSIIITYFVTTELLAVLNLVGIMLKLRRGAMALLLHTPFATLHSLVLGMTLASSGYANVTYAFFRTVGFIELVGLGTTFIVTSLFNNQKYFPIRAGVYGETAICFSIIELIATVTTAVSLNFNLRSSIGWFFIAYAGFFFIFVLGIQVGLIHAMGTDHTNDDDDRGWGDTDWA